MRDPGRPSTASSAGIAASPPHRRASSRRRSAASSEPEVDGPRGWGARRAAADRRREDGPLAPARRGPAQPLLTPQAPGAPLAYRVALATQQRVRGLPALPRMGTGDGPERRRTGPPPPRAPALRDPEAIDEHDHCPPATLRGQKSRPQTPVRARRALPRQARASRTAARSAASAERRRREPKRHGRRRVHRRDRARRSRGPPFDDTPPRRPRRSTRPRWAPMRRMAARSLGEDPDDVGAPLDLLVESFDRVVRPDLSFYVSSRAASSSMVR